MIGEAIGGRLRYQELPPAAKQGMIAHGLPRAFVQAPMVRYARQVGAASAVTGQVERILGRPAHLCPVGRRPRRRVSAIRLRTRPGRPVQALGCPRKSSETAV
jgi:hypothetical protein